MMNEYNIIRLKCNLFIYFRQVNTTDRARIGPTKLLQISEVYTKLRDLRVS